MYCPKCGKENPENSQFCQECATALNADTQAPTQTQQAQQNNVIIQNEKPKKKRKGCLIAVIIVVVLFVIGIIAASSGGSESSGESTNGSNNVVAENGSKTSNVGDYNVELKESRIATDYEGKKILVVTYTFTNNSKESKSFNLSVTDTAFQEGVELGTVWTSYGIDGLSFDNQSKEIKPEKSLDVQCAYELNDETTNVEIEFSLFSVWTDKVYETFVIELK